MPLAPFGTHSVVSKLDQNNVVSTVRGNEVAADSTNGLAQEAAVRQRAGEELRGSRTSRCSRGCRLGVAAALNARICWSTAVPRVGLRPCGVRLTWFDLPRFDVPFDTVEDPSRVTGYYTGLCFKVFRDGVEIGDGGFVDWSAGLLSDRKERMLISGLGIDRLAG